MSNPPPRGSGLSLYANLLDPSASTPGSISKAPVVFKPGANDASQGEDASAKKHQIDAAPTSGRIAALRFQPTRRPQLPNQKPKPKASFPKALPQDVITPKPVSQPASSSTQRPPAKSTLADWTAADDDDVNGFYAGGEKRQRGGRKKRKKNREEYAVAQDWDDIYDPTRPNSYDEYKHSDEKIREVREWKDRLYAHRMARKSLRQFAPPNYSFAPPPIDPPTKSVENAEDDSYSPKLEPSHAPEPPTSLSSLPPPPPPPPPATIPGAISRAPVRYNLPAAPSELPASEAELERALQEEPDEEDAKDDDAPRSQRPGQKGFAERLMSKYGWSKGTGLGADGSGIINPLRVQLEKRKKKSDAEGGGFRDTGGRGKIIGGKRKEPEKDSETGKFGEMSEVIVLRGMVDGMNLDEEVEGSGDGGLMQEIGDECSEKYGRVERVYIDRHGTAPAKVFVKFTSQLSALRAVNALEGRIFNGNTISALFYDTETFEKGIYE
ncbi:G-patch domain-containing protein [Phlyctema vagabunda]|uniref:G-patch domain-containing protein n=1 Tax=Phlyctema vagabunda TaxID=108571 RepID=A0ABR4PMB1_9HELO